MAATTRVGFIGVGLMGHGMAANIRAKGHALTIMGHRNRKPVEDLIAKGAVEAKTPAEVARASDVIFLCVTGSPQVEAAVRGADGIAAAARPGLIVADCSTSDPNSTMALAAELAPKGVAFVDAPLNGTPTQAEAGQLGAMIGADEQTFERLRPVVECWAAKVVRVGPVGAGHKMKLLNNFLAMGYGAIYAEALALAQKSGISPQTFDSVLRGSRMDCGFYQTFFRYVLEGDREAHKFTLSNACKDMKYLESMADAVGLANPVGNAVKNSYALAVAAGRGEDYVPMLSDFVAQANAVKTG
ncbi:MAG: NAD(P)-dependent oxidoreductase [Methylobacteriaceae bacterium]|nr:NAD(P)-dependent oxidoreductase [Methylobacteriaceae bacterium]